MRKGLLLFLVAFSLQGESYFDFPGESWKGKSVFPKSRKVCFFPFINESSEKSLDYLEKSIPAVFVSSLSSAYYLFESVPVADKIYYSSKGEMASLANRSMPGKDPRYISLKTKFYREEEPGLHGFIDGRKKDCYYMISGSYEKSGEDSLVVRIEMLEIYDGRKSSSVQNVTIKRGLQELKDTAVRSFLQNGMRFGSLKITSNEENVLVFVDGMYAGKTPLQREDIPGGEHMIRLFKEGFLPLEKKERISSSGNSLYYELQAEKKQSRLSVKSKPAEADVWLGKTYLGETPLEAQIPSGMNRLRIAREGYVDFFTGVEVKPGEKQEVTANLQEGDTVEYYTDRRFFWQDYTRYDFAIFSFYSSLAFYGGYWYNNYHANRVIDGLRPEITILAPLTVYQTLTASGGSLVPFYTTLFYEEQKIRATQKKAARLRNQGLASAAGGGVMLVLGLYFLFTDLDSETLDIGFSGSFNGEHSFSVTKKF